MHGPLEPRPRTELCVLIQHGRNRARSLDRLVRTVGGGSGGASSTRAESPPAARSRADLCRLVMVDLDGLCLAAR